MKINKILFALIGLPLLYACGADTPGDKPFEEEPDPEPAKPLIIRAALPETRAQITYNNQDVKAGEIFLWDEDDEIFLYNLSNLKDNPKEACFIITKFEDRNAEFEFDYDPYAGHAESFTCVKGDTILAIYGETNREKFVDDPRNVIAMTDIGTESNKPQYVVKDPTTASLKYMQSNLKMYDVAVVAEDDVLPELHFKHLSAILRVTLNNNSGEDIFFTKLEFNYPETNCFFNTAMYFSVNNIENGGYDLIVYDTDEFYNGSKPYTSSIGTTVNGKKGTIDSGEALPNGDSYEFYITTVPRLNNDIRGTELTISFTKDHDTNNPFTYTLKGFNVPIRAGYRYWFDLTITPEKQLILTPAPEN